MFFICQHFYPLDGLVVEGVLGVTGCIMGDKKLIWFLKINKRFFINNCLASYLITITIKLEIIGTGVNRFIYIIKIGNSFRFKKQGKLC